MPNPRARNLQKNLTPAEQKLWSALRRKQIGGHRFRRQHPIGPYVVDFVCLEQNLVIEVDGGQHGEEAPLLRDARRTIWLNGKNYRVVRFWNNQVLNETDAVLDTIQRILSGKSPL